MKMDRRFKPELLTGKEEERPNLTSPYFCSDGEKTHIVATNGFALVAVPVEADAKDTAGWVPIEALKTARKHGKKHMPASVAMNESTAEIEDVASFKRPDHTIGFPPWQSILPSFKRGDAKTVTVGLDAHMLKAIADAIGSQRMVALTIRPGLDGRVLDPILVEPLQGATDETVAMLMPYRTWGTHDVDTGGSSPSEI